jgi:hypothetical protein
MHRPGDLASWLPVPCAPSAVGAFPSDAAARPGKLPDSEYVRAAAGDVLTLLCVVKWRLGVFSVFVWFRGGLRGCRVVCGACGVPEAGHDAEQQLHAARSYSLIRPPKTGRRLICSWLRSGTGWVGCGGRRSRARCGLYRAKTRYRACEQVFFWPS